MGITDYNKKKQLSVDSVSGTPQVDKAQPLIVGGKTIVQEVDGWEDGDLSSNPQWTELFSQSSVDNTIQSSVVKNGSNALEVSVSSGTSSIETLAHDRGGGSVSDGDKYSTWFRVNGNQIFEYGLGSGSGQFSSGDDFVSASVDSQNRVNLSSETEINSNFTTISNDEWFRLEIELNPSQSEAVLRIYDTDNSFIAEDTVSTNGASAYQYVKIQAGGLNSNNNVDAYFDDVSYSSNSTSSLKDYSKTGNGDIVIDFSNISGPEDIAVYDQNGNLLDYEVESLDTTNGTGVLWAYNDWVRDGTTQAQLAYGNNSANTDRQNATGTWNNTGQNAVMVQHLQDDPLTATDATSNNNDGSVNGATATSGQYDGAASFDGIDDFIDYGQTAAFGTTDGTLIVWANPDNVSESFPVFGTGLDHGYYLRTSASSGAANPSDVAQWLWKVDDGSTSEFFVSQLTDGVNTGEYYHLGMVLDNDSDLTGYVDGIESNSGDMSNIGDIDNGANLLQAKVPGGNFGGDAPSPMDMDEFRVYSEVKNSDFMKADFDASPKAGQVFFSQQAAETTSTGVSATVTDSLGFSENTASTLSFTASDNLQVTESAAGTLSDTLSDKVQFSEQVLSTIQDDLTDQLGFTEDTATALVSQVSDQLSFTEQTISNLTLQVLTSDNRTPSPLFRTWRATNLVSTRMLSRVWNRSWKTASGFPSSLRRSWRTPSVTRLISVTVLRRRLPQP